MSPRGVWQVESLCDEGLALRVVQELAAADLVQALFGSKAAARRVLARGQLRRDGVAVQPSVLLRKGERLELTFVREGGPLSLSHEDVTVCYRDPVMLAADKPAGLLVHGDGTGADTLTARVQGYLARRGSTARAQAVQRLDVDTTGLVLFSLTGEFQPVLDAQVAGHDMRKRYLAVVKGRLPWGDEWHELHDPIGRDRHDARRMRVTAGGKPALTRVRTLDVGQGRSLLLVELGSGRKHQIRVHLAHAGYPLLGDTLYGGVHWPDGLMLHASAEQLEHPVTGERLKLASEPPARFRRLFPSSLG